MKSYFVSLIKWSVSITIVSCLALVASNDNAFSDILTHPKHWGYLTSAVLAALVVLVLSAVRWYILLRAARLNITISEVMAIYFLSHFSSYVALGTVGGDVVRAAFAARGSRLRKSTLVASVIVDRVIGMYSLCISASFALIVRAIRQEKLDHLTSAVVLPTLLLTVLFTFVAILPSRVQIRRLGLLRRSTLGRVSLLRWCVRSLNRNVNLCKRSKYAVVAAVALSLVTNGISVLTVFLIASGVPGESPPLSAHFAIVPIAQLSAAVPLPAGLGGMEAAFELLYRDSLSSAEQHGRGLAVAVTLRSIGILLALPAIPIYLLQRLTLNGKKQDQEGVLRLNEGVSLESDC